MTKLCGALMAGAKCSALAGEHTKLILRQFGVSVAALQKPGVREWAVEGKENLLCQVVDTIALLDFVVFH